MRIPKKKIVVQETSSESEEEEEVKSVKSKKKSLASLANNTPEQQLVNQKSEEDIRQELHNQKLRSALRSLGYID